MRRRILIVLLSLGTLGGFASGFHSLRTHSACWRGGEHQTHSCGDASNNAPHAE
jgi:hypothetical protein